MSTKCELITSSNQTPQTQPGTSDSYATGIFDSHQKFHPFQELKIPLWSFTYVEYRF